MLGRSFTYGSHIVGNYLFLLLLLLEMKRDANWESFTRVDSLKYFKKYTLL